MKEAHLQIFLATQVTSWKDFRAQGSTTRSSPRRSSRLRRWWSPPNRSVEAPLVYRVGQERSRPNWPPRRSVEVGCEAHAEKGLLNAIPYHFALSSLEGAQKNASTASLTVKL